MDQVKPEQVTPTELVAEAVELAKKKAELRIIDLLIRGMLAGALLGIATSLAFVPVAQGMAALVVHYLSCRVRDAGLAGTRVGNG
jgi:formate/nitrite transporter FocA (FNT family)